MTEAGLSRPKLLRAIARIAGDTRSEGSLRNYLNTTHEPPLSFLVSFAEVCDVQPEWLILGSGPMRFTDRIEDLQRQQSGYGLSRKLEAIFTKHFRPYQFMVGPERGMIHQAWHTTFVAHRATQLRSDQAPGGRSLPRNKLHLQLAIALRVAKTLQRGIDLFGAAAEDIQVKSYVVQTCLAIMALAPRTETHEPELREAEEPNVAAEDLELAESELEGST